MTRQNLHKTLRKRTLIVILTILSFGIMPSASAQNPVTRMVNHETLQIDACSIGQGTIVDDGGETGLYSNHFDGYVVIRTSLGVPITLTGDYETEGCCDYLRVWDGEEQSGTLLANQLAGTGTVNLTATSGTMTIYFYSDYSVNFSGFVLNYTADVENILGRVETLTATGITQTSATLNWSSTGYGPFHVTRDGVEIGSTSAMTYSLSGLQASQQYASILVLWLGFKGVISTNPSECFAL